MILTLITHGRVSWEVICLFCTDRKFAISVVYFLQLMAMNLCRWQNLSFSCSETNSDWEKGGSALRSAIRNRAEMAGWAWVAEPAGWAGRAGELLAQFVIFFGRCKKRFSVSVEDDSWCFSLIPKRTSKNNRKQRGIFEAPINGKNFEQSSRVKVIQRDLWRHTEAGP